MEILLVGNTGYLTAEAIEQAFPEDNVIVALKGHEEKKEKNIRWFNLQAMDERLERVFDTYDFERVVYISKFVTKDNKGIGEIEELRQVFSLSQKASVRQFVYITSDDAILDSQNSASIIFDSAEKICKYYAHNYLIETKIVFTPYLISGSYKDDYWCDIFGRLEKKQAVEIHALADETAYFLSVPDISRFLNTLFENWNANRDKEADHLFETIYLKSGATTKYAQIYDALLEYYPQARITFRRSRIKDSINYHRNKAKEDYGWFSSADACGDFGKYIEEYRRNFGKKPGIHEKISGKLKINEKVLMIIELIIGAVLVELYNNYAGGSVQFRMIDVRLIFVILMSLVYGTGIGTAAAVIEILSLIYAYLSQGTNGLLLFYDPRNWIPFILLLVAAAICGYVREKKDEEIALAGEENETLRSENRFVSTLYEEAMEYKNRYKQELIGSRDGFGRIFEVVKKLSNTVPEKIFAESIPVMEEVLRNRSIAIYTINDDDSRFARLNVASEPISQTLQKSIDLNNYRKVLSTVKEDEIWFNNELIEEFPMYVAGIKHNGAVSVLIMVYRVEYTQVSTYFSNLIRILSGLIENFILKAWEYQKAIARKIYIDGTAIMKPDYFKRQFEIQKEMAGNRLTSFMLFRIPRENREFSELDLLFQSRVRSSDILGLGEDGNIYLLASQLDDDNTEIVLKRFRNLGLTCDVVENIA